MSAGVIPTAPGSDRKYGLAWPLADHAYAPARLGVFAQDDGRRRGWPTSEETEPN